GYCPESTSRWSNTSFVWNLIAASYEGGLPQRREKLPIAARHGDTKEQGIGKSQPKGRTLRYEKPACISRGVRPLRSALHGLARSADHPSPSKPVQNQKTSGEIKARTAGHEHVGAIEPLPFSNHQKTMKAITHW